MGQLIQFYIQQYIVDRFKKLCMNYYILYIYIIIIDALTSETGIYSVNLNIFTSTEFRQMEIL